ncbi:hypothetical protein BDZ89DRAFT_1148675 [Hymenopellis radicata]|nr:hypothetical protein BDZ89DRAFT_1148675 [Hymenopellis radicata]
MSTLSDDFFNNPAQIAFCNTSMRQRTQQACDKCRERKTKCSGEKPVCKRCSTRGLICQYSARESRPRGGVHSLRNSVSSIELRGESGAQAYQMHREKQREREYYQSLRQNSSNIIPYELASQTPPNHYLRKQPHLMNSSPDPFQSYSQPSSLSGSPVFPSFSPQQIDFSPTSSDGSFTVFPDLPPSTGPSGHQIRRAHSQSALPHYSNFQSMAFTPSLSHSGTAPQPQPHQHQHARSLDMLDMYDPRGVPPQAAVPKYNLDAQYPPPLAEGPPLSQSPFSIDAETSSMASESDSILRTPPSQPMIYNPTPSLPLLLQNVQMLDIKAEQQEYEGGHGKW